MTGWRVFPLILVACWAGVAWGQVLPWRGGVARVDITPEQPIWLAGYAARSRQAEGSLHPLWAKALVLDDGHGNRFALVTLDLVGDNFGRQLSESIADAVARRTGIARSHLVLNFSHTHCGPVSRVTDGAKVTYPLDERQRALIAQYSKDVESKIVHAVQQAATTLQPVSIWFGTGRATFAANRRTYIRPNGPVDHSVPVLKVANEQGKAIAVVFGYACHATTLGPDCYQYNGDYPGFAQIALEQQLPGATAMFVAGCGGDINPAPRGTVELARQHGETLAQAVHDVLTGPMHPVRPPLRAAFRRVALPFVDPPTREELLARRGQGDRYDQRLTEVLLERFRRQGFLERSYPMPVHVIRFGTDLTLVALGGEVVVDYALRLKKDYPDLRLWVAAYCDEVFAYVPSERVLAEGGYEGGGAMRYFGWHGPFQPGIEQRILSAIDQMLKETAPDNRRAATRPAPAHSP